jgi:hypothetical protein
VSLIGARAPRPAHALEHEGKAHGFRHGDALRPVPTEPSVMIHVVSALALRLAAMSASAPLGRGSEPAATAVALSFATSGTRNAQFRFDSFDLRT